MIRCQKCGYTNQSSAKKCIKCQSSLADDAGQKGKGMDTSIDLKFNPVPQPNKDDKKTIHRIVPSSKPCQLIALSEDEKEVRAIPIKGETVNLNRDFLDPENTSISRKGHASLQFKDGSWYVDNVTELKTTFIQVNRPHKLSDGDIILLGDSLYKFKENS